MDIKPEPKPEAGSGSKSGIIVGVVAGAFALLLIALFFSANSGGDGGGGAPVGSSAEMGATEKDSTNVVMDEPFDASLSPNVPTVTEVRNDLASRGFENALLTTNYDILGNHFSTEILATNSDERYPSYIVEYLSENNHAWYIYVNNGNYYARAMFEIRGSTGAYVLSELDYLTSYDANSNTYTNIVPGTEELIMKKVARIDKMTLDNLTAEEIEEL